MTAATKDNRAGSPREPIPSVTQRQQAYREARVHGLVVAPPLNPPPR